MAADLQETPIDNESRRGSRLRSMNEYAREVRLQLPPELFRRAPIRLLWLPFHAAIIIAMSALIICAAPPWYIALACALVAGHSWGCLGLLAHETLHHAVVKSPDTERLIGMIGFLPFCLSPTLWVAWHNQAHHRHTGNLFLDPDHFGTLHLWKKSRYVRFLESLTPGSGSLRSAAFLCIFFSLNSLLMLTLIGEQKGFYARISRRVVWAETAAMVAVWLAVLALVGVENFVLVALLPALVANAVVMSYIATNHLLSPFTSVNDPFANTLSVTNPRWLETLHLQFGYHVEHHIFPAMSAKHSRAVREVLVRSYGSRYLSMPHRTALRLVYTRPKLRCRADVLVNPRSGAMYRTLRPGDLSLPELPPAPMPLQAASARSG